MAAGRPETPRESETTRPMRQAVARLAQVTLRYEDVCALDDVTLEIATGQRVCVLGANGSGKSTLASVLAGILAPDAGSVELAGEQVYTDGAPDFDAYRRARRDLGLVFQNPDDQIVTSIVEEDVAFGPENLGLPPAEIGLRVSEELRRVAMQAHAKADPAQLSGGQKQRVAIAGALALRPQLLVLDEPGALLDVRGRRGIMRVMRELKATGVTIVHITHFMEEALEADRVLVMERGRIVADGTPREVFARGEWLTRLGLEAPFVVQLSEALRARGLQLPWTCDAELLQAALAPGRGPAQPAPADGAKGLSADGTASSPLDGVNNSPADVTSRPLPDVNSSPSGSTGYSLPDGMDKPSLGTGSLPHGAPREKQELPAGDAAVIADRIVFSYGHGVRTRALDQVTFSVPRGSSTAVIGQTGSGKSTLVRILCALEVPDAGTATIDGIATTRKRDRRRLHGHIGYVMQRPERQLFAETVYEDVSYGPRNLGLAPEEVERRTRYAIKLVGLRGREDASPFHLSGGQQRLCAIAGILAMEPTVLVLDEPSAGLDPKGRAQLNHLISDVHRSGTTIVLVTHSMDTAALADQVVVLSDGQVLLQGRPGDVFANTNERLLHDAGLGIPHALAWARRMEQQGMPPLGDPLTLEQLADGIAFRARQMGWQLKAKDAGRA